MTTPQDWVDRLHHTPDGAPRRWDEVPDEPRSQEAPERLPDPICEMYLSAEKVLRDLAATERLHKREAWAAFHTELADEYHEYVRLACPGYPDPLDVG